MSISHAVMELIEELSNATDNKKHAIGVFIDLKMNFDTSNHELLIKQLTGLRRSNQTIPLIIIAVVSSTHYRSYRPELWTFLRRH